MHIYRQMLTRLNDAAIPGRAVIIQGPHQSGLISIVEEFHHDFHADLTVQRVTGDDLNTRETFSRQDIRAVLDNIGDAKILLVDEGHLIPDLYAGLLHLLDLRPDLLIIVTMPVQLKEVRPDYNSSPGRIQITLLLPPTYLETVKTLGMEAARSQLDQRLIWGSFPGVIFNNGDKSARSILEGLTSSLLYRDMQQLEEIRHPDKILDLLRLVAFQIGQDVSIQALADSLDLSQVTVNKYLDLLVQAFFIFRLNGFQKNLKTEITKTCRYYFVDNGVRNALIQNFNSLNLRNDVAELWENYLMSERKKINIYSGSNTEMFFWRTYDHKEIDLLEVHKGIISGYDFKWTGEMKRSILKSFTEAYQEARVETVNKVNFENFLIPD